MSGRTTDPDTPPDASPYRFAVVASEFHRDVTSRLLDGALECLSKHGASDVLVRWVPGAFELPLAAQLIAEHGDADAVVAVGCVIRGETPHFDYVCGAAANGLMQASLATSVPMAFGVLTTDTQAQADARAGGAVGNKGWDAALTAIQMAILSAGILGEAP